MATFVNYTKRPVAVDGFPMMVPRGDASGAVLSGHGDHVDGMPMRDLTRVTEALPEREDGTYYVVSPMVAAMFPERDDLVFAVGVRASSDHVTRCSALGRVSRK